MTPETVTHATITLPPITISAGNLDTPAPLPEPTTATSGLILFCREGKRARAARFSTGEAEAAAHAAQLMGMHTLIVGDANSGLADRVARGKLYEKSGKALIPYCAASLATALLAAAGLPNTPMHVKATGKAAEAPPALGGAMGSGDGPSGAGGAAKPPADDPWAAINLGSVVLAKGDDEDGYYAAKISATKANQNFVLLWENYPDLMEFTRHRHDLGLLRPGPEPQAK